MEKEQSQREIEEFFTKMGLETEKQRRDLLDTLAPHRCAAEEQVFIRIKSNTSMRKESVNAKLARSS